MPSLGGGGGLFGTKSADKPLFGNVNNSAGASSSIGGGLGFSASPLVNNPADKGGETKKIEGGIFGN